jgi:hypothetical protein
MRCGSCSKFVSFDTDQEPETDDLSVDEEGHVIGSVRIVNCCAECGDELKEASIDVEDAGVPEDLKTHLEKELPDEGSHDLELEVTSSERTERSEGQGRGRRTFYGAAINFSVTCSCDSEFTVDGSVSVEVQASSMEENS